MSLSGKIGFTSVTQITGKFSVFGQLTMKIPAWLDLSRSTMRRITVFELIYRLISIVIISPFSFYVVYRFVQFSGHPSIGNLDLSGFFLSLPGIGAMIGFGALFLTGFYFEISGLLLNLRPTQNRLNNPEILQYLVIHFHRLLLLGLMQVLTALIMILPGAVLTLLMIEQLWDGWDLNTLVILKPVIFWKGVGLGVAINAIPGFFVVRQLLRWSMAVPILLFSGKWSGVRQILEESHGLTSAHLNAIGKRIVGWFLVQSVITVATLLLLEKSADGILDLVGFSVVLAIPATIVILISHFLVVNLVSIVFNVSFACILVEIYERLKGPLPLHDGGLLQSSHKASVNRLAFSAIALLGLISGVSVLQLNSLDIHDEVEVIAHRAGGALAPENTIAALKNAIRLGCEWAEIDVQLTSDQKIIVAHDTDLRRLAHLNKAVQECTLAEIQSLDVGSAFSAEFKGEQIPTLEDFLNVAKDKIRIVIELKPHSQQDAAPLARAVVNLLQKRGETTRHRVCSLSYEAVQSVRRDDPSIELGFIVAQAVGPIEKLDADFFMIDQKMATQKLVERCKAVGNRFVLAWTVDNPDKVLPLIDNGVRGIITDNPPLIRERYDELRNLSTLGRLVIRVRNEIAD